MSWQRAAALRMALVANVIQLGPWLCKLGQWCYVEFVRNLVLDWHQASDNSRLVVGILRLDQRLHHGFMRRLLHVWMQAAVLDFQRPALPQAALIRKAVAMFEQMFRCRNWHGNLSVFGYEVEEQPRCSLCSSRQDVVGCGACGVICSHCLSMGGRLVSGRAVDGHTLGHQHGHTLWHQFKARLQREQLGWRRVYQCPHEGLIEVSRLAPGDSRYRCGICRTGNEFAVASLRGCIPCGFVICGQCCLNCDSSPPPPEINVESDYTMNSICLLGPEQQDP